MAAPRSAIPAWVSPYIGLPFLEHGRDRSGVDCWGLVRLALAERFGVDVPSYVGRGYSIADKRELAALMRGEVAAGWTRVSDGGEREGDVVWMSVEGFQMHVGLVIADGWMLHILEGIDACTEAYDGPLWRRRVLGFYRQAVK